MFKRQETGTGTEPEPFSPVIKMGIRHASNNERKANVVHQGTPELQPEKDERICIHI